MKRVLMSTLAIGVGYWAAKFVMDRFILKSDSADPTGFIVQTEGFGLDDVVEILGVGAAGTLALKFLPH